MRLLAPTFAMPSADPGENLPERLSTMEADGILIRDHAAARRWLVSVIAARAVELHRERRKRSGNEAKPDGDDHGNAHGKAEWQRKEGRR